MASADDKADGSSRTNPFDVLAHQLYRAVQNNDINKVRFLAKGISKKDDRRRIAGYTFEGNAPLFQAAKLGHVHIAKHLLESLDADIEQRGFYEVESDHTKHQVTPLWCAAVADRLEVVRLLVEHGADINAPSDTDSTPVRSACYMSNIQVIKYLVEKGCDIHKPNHNGGTCLINSVQSVELCTLLIQHGVNVNAKDNTGNLALHYAIREGRMDTVEVLLSHGSDATARNDLGNLALHYAIREGRMDTVELLLSHGSDATARNDLGDDALITAALRGNTEILDYLVKKVKPPPPQAIDALELMATHYIDERHDLQAGIDMWRRAMSMRYGNPLLVYPKPPAGPPKPAYLNQQEAQNLDELQTIATSPDAIYMHSLLTRERILGRDHKDTVFGLMYRGAVYADTHEYQRCVDLWKYAFELRHSHVSESQEDDRGMAGSRGECIFTLQALCKLFWEIHEEFISGYTQQKVRFEDASQVLAMAVEEVGRRKSCDECALHEAVVGSEEVVICEERNTLLMLVLHLIHLLTKISKSYEERQILFTNVQTLVNMRPFASNGRTLLHLAADKKISQVADEFYSHFPSVEVTSLLLDCGAPVNALDRDKNSVLHVCAEGLNRLLTQRKYHENLEEIVGMLVARGAHVDIVNTRGINASMLLRNRCPNVRILGSVTLKCLAARAVKKFNLPYHNGNVPHTLVPFINVH